MTVAEFEEFIEVLDNDPDIGITYKNKFGESFCGRPKVGKGAQEGQPCGRAAGWGTTHQDKGACKFHGGNDRNSALMSNNKRIALIEHAENSYAAAVKNEKLRALITKEAANEQLDNLDGEIILIRSFIKLICEDFGIGIEEDDETGNLSVIRFMALSSEAKTIAGLVEDLSKLIEKKYRISQMAGENVPRETVRAYINQIQIVLSKVLRNNCAKCGDQHNMLDVTFAGLALVGNI